MTGSEGEGVRRFFELEARMLIESARIVETLLPHPSTRGSSHRAEEGRHIEALVRAFLNRHLPTSLRAVSGFILRPSTKVGESDRSRVMTVEDEHSGQLDVIVYDVAAFPVYERFEEFAIVPPEGVVAIISVKKTLYKRDVRPELLSLQQAVRLCRVPPRRSPFSALFCLTADRALTTNGARFCFEAVKAVHSGDPFDLMITEISTAEGFTLFKARMRDTYEPGHAKYLYPSGGYRLP